MSSIIGITMGDPAGIGPEVTIKALDSAMTDNRFHPLVIGNIRVFEKTLSSLGIERQIKRFNRFSDITFDDATIALLEVEGGPSVAIEWGKANRFCGELSYQSVVKAVKLCLEKKISAVVTAPICKESWHLAGHAYDGHTELLAHLTGAASYRMMFMSEKLNVILVTTHLPLAKVTKSLSRDSIFHTIQLGVDQMQRTGINAPRVAVCGVNPHAGEAGIFGDEEERVISPAIEQAKNAGMDVQGPYPSDTVFLRAWNGEFDLVVAQYHDQALIPIKLTAFSSAVNVTVGLPIIRTSVDHGTAFEIAGKGKADPANMIHAIRQACRFLDE